MTRLVWGLEQLKNYESGVSNGVLYGEPNMACVWDGILSVSKTNDGSSASELFFDAKKVYAEISPGTPKFTVTALLFPLEFFSCLGVQEPRPGFFLTGQPKSKFNLTYKTLIGSSGYKIHLVSNAIVTSSDYSYASISESTTPEQRTFNLATSPPPAYSENKPSSYMVIDSTKTDPVLLSYIEDVLYGTSTTSPAFLTQEALVNML